MTAETDLFSAIDCVASGNSNAPGTSFIIIFFYSTPWVRSSFRASFKRS